MEMQKCQTFVFTPQQGFVCFLIEHRFCFFVLFFSRKFFKVFFVRLKNKKDVDSKQNLLFSWKDILKSLYIEKEKRVHF